jgi:hypothetical protein
MEDNDHDKDGYITTADFKDYYRSNASKKTVTVWQNVNSWKYNSEMKKIGFKKEKRDARTLLRATLP